LKNCRDNINLSFLYETRPVEVFKLGRRAVGDKLELFKGNRGKIDDVTIYA
jgi:hypothetical protein